METPRWTFDRAEEYHARTEFLSSGRIKLGMRSLAHVAAAMKEPVEQTPAMALGALIHTAVLEPENLEREYIKSPKFDRRTKEGKAQAEAFEQGAQGRRVVSEDDMRIAEGCTTSIRSHAVARELLEGAKVESSIYWKHEETGLLCKARPDAYNPESGILIDLKSTQDAGPKFARDLFSMNYHVQLAYYSMAIEAIGFAVNRVIIIAIEKTPPFELGLYELDSQTLALGAHKVREFLPRYAEALRTDIWPGYPAQIQTISPPTWAFE